MSLDSDDLSIPPTPKIKAKRFPSIRFKLRNGEDPDETPPSSSFSNPNHHLHSLDFQPPNSPFVDQQLKKESEKELTFDTDDSNDNLPDLPNHSQHKETKRTRWATIKRNKKQNDNHHHHGVIRGDTIRRIFHHKPKTHDLGFSDNLPPQIEPDQEPSSLPRTIVFNGPVDEPHDYCRNKIRTTKYSPLSFLPKNIYNQFRHNIANVYFLILIILGAFEIFGVPSPVLAAVPLIVIVIITAIKDGIEDSRRTVTDMEVNNQYTHILEQVGFDTDYVYLNNNVNEEEVSTWRKFKKTNTRFMVRLWGASKRNLTKEGRANKARQQAMGGSESNLENQRRSFDSEIGSPRNSLDSNVSARPSMDNPFRAHRSHGPKTLKFNRKFWKDVRVGDVLRIYNNEEIPADLVLLSTSDPDNSCYIETKNLDGETNLKVKTSLKATSDISRADDLITEQFVIDSEGPHANLYSYQGNFKFPDNRQESININNLLLRGCTLRNTKWVIGVVAYTGDDTKIMLNAGVTPTKQSRLSRELNYYVLLNFIFLFVICFVSGLVNGLYYRKTNTSRDYFEFGTIAGSPATNGFVGFFVALILYQSLVPISLYITIEIIKTAQAYFIYSDVGMYYAKLDFPCTPKSWSISDDLGQIEYIFSDKTGTLTQNLMEFKKCTINGVSYGRAYTEALAGLRKRMGVDVETEAAQERELIRKDLLNMIEKLHTVSKSKTYDDEITFVSSAFVDDLIQGGQQLEANHHFMLALSLCHTVMTEQDPKAPNKLLLKAQSPDEAALVGTARSLGFNFKGSTKRGLLVDIQGTTKEYQVLNTLEFNSTRKRMSSIIKIPGATPQDEPKALLICKGADSIIYDRLSNTNNNPAMLEQTSKHLEEYATEGLRTLCIAQRELSWSEYTEWNKRHQEAASSLEDRDDKMEVVADSIERELTLLGGTAIEDRLQDGVPDAIQLLAEAGIKLWVLTGDKVETAINIGFSCNLLGNEMKLLVIKTNYNEDDQEVLGGLQFGHNTSEPEIIDTVISHYLRVNFDMEGSFEEKEAAVGDHSPPDERFGVVIDGDALKLALSNNETKRKFLLLCKKCRAVLCCRVSPAQKAAVVKLVKDTLNVMTLAIGDGSNDVAMIQAADVGVGIAGEEGRQAVMSSDYAIGQFRFLARLLLTHGRWSYKRFSEMIPSFFYKNIIFNIALFWYGIYCDFDGTYLFEFTYLMFYNLAFTSLPVIFLGIFDQDVDAKVSLLVPQIYRTGISRTEMSDKKFYWYCLDGIYQSAISFFFPYLLYMIAFPSENGKPVDHRFWMGVLVTCIACISCNCYILFHQYRWDWLSSLIVAISILIIFIWTGLWTINYQSSGEFYKAAPEIFGMTAFWACMFVGILCCLIPRFFYDFVTRIFWPRDIDIIRECVARGDFAAYPADYDPTDPNRPKISTYSSQALQRMSLSSPKIPQLPLPGESPFADSNKSHYYDNDDLEDRVTPPSVDYDRGAVFDNVHRNDSGVYNQPPTPPPGIAFSPIRKRKNFLLGMFRTSSDGIFHLNGHSNGSNHSVLTEEIQLEDFEQKKKRVSEISDESQQKRVSSMY
ncbi:Phospholipid-transporting ATPase DNF1 [Candida viswanathii]|uniref:Phospholipid-transporting ATPase n=1 Tax=Candida viswanathii TaxID=5486 RepID=A0A367YGY3_9ASCO|nr:Phospholipid-transporting ATPase DNF1 [Candida viswanathii]